MKFNLNLYKETITELVALGLTNYYTQQPLCTQKERLVRDAIREDLIEVRN